MHQDVKGLKDLIGCALNLTKAFLKARLVSFDYNSKST